MDTVKIRLLNTLSTVKQSGGSIMLIGLYIQLGVQQDDNSKHKSKLFLLYLPESLRIVVKSQHGNHCR